MQTGKQLKVLLERLNTLIPPETIKDAKELASGGDHVVPLLKYSPQWKTKQIVAAVRALAMINTDKACEALCEYVVDHRSTVLMQIQKSLEMLSDRHVSKLLERANLTIMDRMNQYAPDIIQFENCYLISNLDHLEDFGTYRINYFFSMLLTE